MATVTVTYCGMEGTGRNVTQAKQDAARKIEAVLSGYWSPVLIRGRKYLMLVYREPNGWRSKLIDPRDTKARIVDTVYGNFIPGSTQDEAVADASRHLAQVEIDLDAPDPFFPPPYLTHDRDVREWRSYVAWQLAARHAQKLGMSDNDMHRWACEHCREFEPQAA